jgi:hypothetical protein
MLGPVTLRGTPVEQRATLPDGRAATVRVGILPDPYVDSRQVDTVSVELLLDGQHAAFVNTVLEPEQEIEARRLAREIARRLEEGRLAPTAGAIEPLADELR